MNNEKSKFILSRIDSAMGCLAVGTDRLPWFYAFGTMLEFVADRTFGLKYDIDIGVMYDQYSPDYLIRTFESFGYKYDRKFVDDVTKMPYNMHFRPDDGPLKGTPEIDVYAFRERGNNLLYTYDVKDDGTETPQKGYIFKSVPKELILPPEADIDHYLKHAHPSAQQVLKKPGVWKYWIFEDHGPYTVNIPWAYGTLCDLWYPGWRFRSLYKGQSMSRKTYEVKSCKELW
jgi:hypothetical protein